MYLAQKLLKCIFATYACMGRVDDELMWTGFLYITYSFIGLIPIELLGNKIIALWLPTHSPLRAHCVKVMKYIITIQLHHTTNCASIYVKDPVGTRYGL